MRSGPLRDRPAVELRAFSQSIKDHTLKAHGVDHTVIDIDLSSEDGDYIELQVEIGHDEHRLASNSVLLLCQPATSSPTQSPSSPTATAKPN